VAADANRLLIERFYAALGERDGATMAGCYAPDVTFSDPVFPDLRGSEAGAMWRMLTASSADLRVELLEHEADDATGTAHWRATYTFSRTGRAVVNDIHARFRFANGLIVEHHDSFDFYRWARQALGTSGLLLGWTPMLRNKVRAQAASGLAKFAAAGSGSASEPAGETPASG
jgi:ketosteroid isomerase-like protein